MSSDDSDSEKKKSQGSDMKFDELMKAAVSIKTEQLAQKKRFFESLPTFLQAGVYYTKKLETIRAQSFDEKLKAYQQVKDEGGEAFKKEDWNRACRKYEEALCIWRYYYCTNTKWEEEGIDDNQLKHYEAIGDNPEQIFKLREIKITSYLNIAVCSIKMKAFLDALKACDEALKLDTKNVKGYFLRARARILDINSGVDELKIAVRDLKEGLKIDPENKSIISQLQKILKLVNINSKREKETYLNMFDKNNSVEDYVKTTIKQEVEKVQKQEEQAQSKNRSPLLAKHKQKFEKKVQKYMKMKADEFSFEVKKVRDKIPEIEEVKKNIENGEQAIELFLRSGKVEEAKQLKTSLQQARYEIEMLDCVMNLDFSKPKAKAKAMADEMGIDLTDPVVINEFQKMQKNRLKELRDVKDGKKKPGENAEEAHKEEEDYNSVFRQSNTAFGDGTDSADDNMEQPQQEEHKEEAKHVDQQEQSQPRHDDDLKMNEDEDESDYNLKYIIVGAVFCLWFTSLCYLFMYRS